MDVNLSTPPLPTTVSPAIVSSDSDAPAAPLESASFRTGVLARIIASSVPAMSPKGWPFLPALEEARQLQFSAFELGLRLKQEFNEQQLIADGVIAKEPDSVEPRIFGPNADKFVVELDAANSPIGISTTRGQLFIAAPTAITSALARADSEATTGPTPLFATETVDDLQVLRSLGLQAVLSAGLQSIDEIQVRKLFASNTCDDHHWRYRLIIVDWNVAELNIAVRPRAQTILKRLSLMQELYAHDPAIRFSRWRPSSEGLDRIRVAASFRDADLIRKLLKASLPKVKLGTTWRFHVKNTPLTYAAARARLRSLVLQSEGMPLIAETKKALEQFRKLYDDQLLARVYQMSDVAKSPLVGTACIEFAELHEKWFESQRLVIAAKKVIDGCRPDPGWESDMDDLKDRLRLNSALLQLRRNLQSS